MTQEKEDLMSGNQRITTRFFFILMGQSNKSRFCLLHRSEIVGTREIKIMPGI